MTETLLRFRRLVQQAFRPAAPAVVTVLVLALGVGLATAMFSIFHGLFLRPLPFDEPENLVQVDARELGRGIERRPLSAGEYREIQEAQTSFEQIAGWYGVAATLGGAPGAPERSNAAHVSADLFALLRLRPELGRAFEPADEVPGAAPVVLLSDDLWHGRFGGRADVVGRAVRIDGSPATVIGVMPAGFHFPLSQELWLPLRLDPTKENAGLPFGLEAVARLRPGVSRARAQAELDGIARSLAQPESDPSRGVGFTVRSYVDAYSDPAMRRYLARLLVLALAVLLVACANASSLLLARAARRSYEAAVRRVLGAGRWRIVRQLVGESLVLALAGGGLGLGIAAMLASAVERVAKPMLRSFWVDVRVDGPVALFLLLLTLAVGVLAGLVPALRASGAGARVRLQESAQSVRAPRTGRFGSALVVAQIAATTTVLLVCGLVVASLLNIRRAEARIEVPHVLSAQLSLPAATYPDGSARARFARRLVGRLEEASAFRAAALASSLPGEGGAEVEVELEGSGEPLRWAPRAQVVAVTPGYFSVFGIRALAGRLFRRLGEVEGFEPTVVTTDFARRYFGAAEPLGRRIRIAGSPGESWLTVVGVVPDVVESSLPRRRRGVLPLIQRADSEAAAPGLYVLLSRNPVRWPIVAVRTEGKPLDSAPELRSRLAGLDPDLPALHVQPFEERVEGSTWDYRLFGKVILLFGLVAFLLAACGLFSLVTFEVAARRSELGVRSALGARPLDNLGLVLRAGLGRLAAGGAVGLAVALGVSRLLSALLFEVDPRDPWVFASVGAVLAASGLLACLGPALSAARLPPMEVLR